MKDRSHDEAMAELFRDDPAFAAEYLNQLLQDGEPADLIVTLGYSGWSAGQLEYELAQNAWLSTKADPEVIFRLPPEERLSAAMQNLGVSYSSLNFGVGHA